MTALARLTTAALVQCVIASADHLARTRASDGITTGSPASAEINATVLEQKGRTSNRRRAAVRDDRTGRPCLISAALAGRAASGRPPSLARSEERHDVDEQQERHDSDGYDDDRSGHLER